jgi:restriction system-associated AAA family ATPase
MKLNYFKILSTFRGLRAGYKIEFTNHSNNDRIEPICFVGLNGSGKSNVLEALSEAFFYLEAYSEERSKYQLRKYKTGFGFDLELAINPAFQDSNISFDQLRGFTWSGTENIRIQYLKERDELPKMILHGGAEPVIIQNRDHFILPNRIVGYSSGMNELISNPFYKIDFFYVENLREQARGEDTYRPQLNRMFLLDYEANKIATICSQIYSRDNNIGILNAELELSSLNAFCIYLRTNRPNFVNFRFPSSISLIIEKLTACATSEGQTDSAFKKKLVFQMSDDTRQKFYGQWRTAFDLFRDLYQLRLMNTFLFPDDLIKRARDIEVGKSLSSWLPKGTPINQIFYIDDISFMNTSNEVVYYKQLSDGEHQLLHSLSGLMLLEARNSIFIFDEPDTHFNPEWRSKYISLVNQVLNDRLKEQLIFVTTHSPFIISDCKRENVFLFTKGELQPANPALNTFGTSVNILTEEIFKKRESISDSPLEVIEKIKSGDLNTLEDIQIAKESARVLGESVEKVLLFRELLIKENQLRQND